MVCVSVCQGGPRFWYGGGGARPFEAEAPLLQGLLGQAVQHKAHLFPTASLQLVGEEVNLHPLDTHTQSHKDADAHTHTHTHTIYNPVSP